MPEPRPPLAWDVSLPEGGAVCLGWRRPCGIVTVSTSTYGDESFSVPVSVARKMRAERKAGRLNPGSRNELVHQMGELAQGCASFRVVGLVEKRDYSSKEIADKLGLDGYSRPVIEAAVARAVDCHLVDDARYADVFIRSRLSQGWGSLKIERELGRRGIAAESVAGWPESFFSDVCEEDVAYDLARGRRLTGKNDYEKIVHFLYGRGYSGDISSRVARRVLDEVTSGS